MAGQLVQFAPSVVHLDNNGNRASGAKLYIYEEASLVPVTGYTTSALSVAHAWPVVADANGRFTAPIWLADNTYRVILKDSANGTLADFATPALAYEAAAGSGSTADTWETGDTLWLPAKTTKSGWTRLNGRTIGNASSGGTERANNDCYDQFVYLYTNFSDSICAVSGGRGASAAADWAANKTITLLDMRGRLPYGLDDMGNSAASRFAGTTIAVGSATTGGSTVGVSTVTLTKAQLPTDAVTGTVSTALSSLTLYVATGKNLGSGGETVVVPGPTVSTTTSALSASTLSSTLTGDAMGSGSAHDNLPPGILGTWLMRL